MTFNSCPALAAVIDYFFPAHCIACGTQGGYLCTRCKRNLLPHPEICPLCHRFSADYETCLDCKSEKTWFLQGIIIPFCYSNEIKKLILKLKYGHKKDVIDFLTDRLMLALQINKKLQSLFILHSSLFISYVPSHRYRKLFIKGYNQSQLLAERLSKRLGVPCLGLVQKIQYTKSQAGLARKGRLENLQHAFLLSQKHILTGDETILLVDDVMTTGATLNQIAVIIKKSYPRVHIRGLVIARHSG